MKSTNSAEGSLAPHTREETRNPVAPIGLGRALWPLTAPAGAFIILIATGLDTGARAGAILLIGFVFAIGTWATLPEVSLWLTRRFLAPLTVVVLVLVFLGFWWLAEHESFEPVLSEANADRGDIGVVVLMVALLLIAFVVLVFQTRLPAAIAVRIRGAETDTTKLAAVSALVAPLVIAALYIFFFLLVSSSFKAATVSTEWSRWAFFLAFVLCILALATGLATYVVTFPRVVVVLLGAAATVLVLLRLLDLPADNPVHNVNAVAWPMALLVAAALICLAERQLWYMRKTPGWALRLFYRSYGSSTRVPQRMKLMRTSVVAAVLGAVALLLSSAIARGSSRPHSTSGVGEATVTVGRADSFELEPLELDADSLRTDLARKTLALKLAPILTAVDSQEWKPITVDSYLRGSTLLDWKGEPLLRGRARPETVQELDAAAGSCPDGAPEPCFTLTHWCPKATEWSSARSARKGQVKGLDKALECGTKLGARGNLGEADIGAAPAYVRTIVRSHADDPEAAHVFRDLTRHAQKHDFLADLEVIVQYWYLFAFDDWRGETILGELRQFHEGDWESVTVGVSREKPLFVAYSAHCGGEWLEWNEAPVNADRPTQAVAFLGQGSHASYPVTDAGAAPNWASCLPVGDRKLSAMTLGLNVTETVGEGVLLQTRKPSDVHLVNARTPPMTFRGRWGRQSGMIFAPLDPFGSFIETYVFPGDGGGPLTPPLQRPWFDPLEAIFGSGSRFNHVSISPTLASKTG